MTAVARSPKLFVAAPPSLLASGSVSVARRTYGPPPSSPPFRSRAFDLLVSSRYREKIERKREKWDGWKQEGNRIEARGDEWSERERERVLHPAARLIWFSSKFDAPSSLGGAGTKSAAPVRPCVCHGRNPRRFSIDSLSRWSFFIYPPSTAQRPMRSL